MTFEVTQLMLDGFLMGLAGIVCAGLIWGAILRHI